MENPCMLSPAIETRVDATSYCGPVAIAALTGLSVVDVERAVIEMRKDNPPPKQTRARKRHNAPVTSMWATELAPALNRLGYSVALVADYRGQRRKPTLDRYAIAHALGDLPQLVIVTGHALALHRRHVVDTCTRTPTHVYRTRIQRKHVLMAWNVTKQTEAGQ
jgi:hypothetical protein